MRDSYQAFTEMMKRDNEFSAIIFDIREYPAYDFSCLSLNGQVFIKIVDTRDFYNKPDEIVNVPEEFHHKSVARSSRPLDSVMSYEIQRP